uniref:inosine/xanthosine triphosphatase n=1 Tax=Arcella intermedia TaxID=1963864 RepID=A0A6B2LKT4_9EUKA
MTDEETYKGALQRARNAKQSLPEGVHYWVGLEGGVQNFDPTGELLSFGWAVVLSSRSERIGKGRTATFILPQEIATLVRSGVELGEADDRVFSKTNSKSENGAIGLLTQDIITRAKLSSPAVLVALIPFLNTKLSFQ